MKKYLQLGLSYLRDHKSLSVYFAVIALALPVTVMLMGQEQNTSSHASAAPLAIDVEVGQNQATPGTTLTSPVFSTKADGEMVVVFLASDGVSYTPQVFSGVTGGNLAFNLVKRANGKEGETEIWYAYAPTKLTNAQITATRKTGSYEGMIRVVTFTGAKNVLGASQMGSGKGVASISLTTTAANSWVLAIGNDADKAITRTVGANQTLTQQFIDAKIHHTFWTQQITTPSPVAGSVVTITNTEPTGDQWNLAAVEVVPAEVQAQVAQSNQTGSPFLHGLIAAYSFDEPNGTTSSDASGNGIVGTLTNGPAWVAGKSGYGNALRFDGTNDFVSLGNPPALQVKGSMTISAWVNSVAFPGDDAAIVSKRGTNNIGFQLDTTRDRGQRTIGFKLTNNVGSSMIRYGATPLQLGNWYYVTGVYDAAAGKIDVYLNGNLDNGFLYGTITPTQQDSPLNVNIGRRANGGYLFNGLIDDVRMYNRALSQSEIQSQMSGALIAATTATSPTKTISSQSVTIVPTATLTPVPTRASSTPSTMSGWPNDSNTGWEHTGVQLTQHNGDLRITTDGTVVEGLDIHDGTVYVYANNVTIRRSRLVHAPIETQKRVNVNGNVVYTDYTGTLIEDVEFDGRPFVSKVTAYRTPVAGVGTTCVRCNIHHWGTGMILGNNGRIEDSYVHDIVSEGDAATTGSHNYSAGTTNGSHIIIRHNNLECGADNCSAATPLFPDFGPTKDNLIENNLFNGGQYCIYGGSTNKPFASQTSGVRFLNNHFGKKFFPKCGHYGTSTAFDSNLPGNQWSGNVWDDTGASINP